MTIGIADRKILWGRSANRCAFPGCAQVLVYTGSSSTVLGEEAHIVGASLDGPRGDDPLPLSERDRYTNLILLCPTHHTIIDKSPQDYPVDVLHSMKREHEEWVTTKLGTSDPDPVELRYAQLVQGWEERTIASDWWQPLTSALFSPRMTIRRSTLEEAGAAGTWLATRKWPKANAPLERALAYFEQTLNDLLRTYWSILELYQEEGEVYWFEPFYKMGGFNPHYHDHLAEYDWIGSLLPDIGLEMCRAANAVCDEVMQSLDPLYRLEEGLVVVTATDLVFGTRLYPAQLRESDERYDGLADFATVRASRDFHIGTGFNAAAAKRLGL